MTSDSTPHADGHDGPLPDNVAVPTIPAEAPAPGYDPLIAFSAKLVVFSTFLTLFAGSLVTGFKAALSDPTWPQFVGYWYPKFWVGGLRFEDSHRLNVV